MPHRPDDPRSDEVSAATVDLSRRMDNGFNRVDAKLERHGEAIAGLDGRATGMEGRMAALEDRMVALEGRMVALENRMTGLEDRMTAEFTAVRKEMSEGFQRMQRLMIQVGGGIVVTLLAASRFLG